MKYMYKGIANLIEYLIYKKSEKYLKYKEFNLDFHFIIFFMDKRKINICIKFLIIYIINKIIIIKYYIDNYW